MRFQISFSAAAGASIGQNRVCYNEWGDEYTLYQPLEIPAGQQTVEELQLLRFLSGSSADPGGGSKTLLKLGLVRDCRVLE